MSLWKDKREQTDGTVTHQQNPPNINEAITNASDTKTVRSENNGEGENTASNESGRTTQKVKQLQSSNRSTNADEMGDKPDENSEIKGNTANELMSKGGDVTICSSRDNLIEEEKGEATSSSNDHLIEEEKGESTSFSNYHLTEEEKGESTSHSNYHLSEEEQGESTISSNNHLSEDEKGEATSNSHANFTEEEKGEATSSSNNHLIKEEEHGEATGYSRDNLTEEEEGEALTLHDAFVQTDKTPRLPDYLPAEESNFLRFCHLIQKVAPQAVRHRFDQMFPPADLEGIIQQNITVLKDLYHNRIITRPQWKLICPTGTAPLSSTFDITTMVCLFRHLTNTSPYSGFYDTLPPTSDVSLGADLSRIKYFRNNIAHYLEKDRKIDNNDFPIVWETASMAVSRLGGEIYEQECSSLRTANLDSSYMDIYREVLIKEIDLELKISDLTSSHQQLQSEHEKKISDLTSSHQQLQSEHKKTILDLKKAHQQLQSEQKKEIKQLQIKLEDPVPKHERENINFMTNKWEENKQLFIETSAAIHLIKIMKAENVAIVTGSPGTGKTFTVQNVLLSMREEGYDVIPVRSSSDLVRYFSRSARQVFFLDNLCGKHNISNSDIEEWDRNRDTLDDMFTNSSTKCIFICRLHIVLDPKFQNLKLKEFNIINLSGAHRLTLEEKQSIGQIYIGKSIMEQLTDQTITNCLCFPLLCSLYDKQDKHTMNTTAYFEKPKQFFETELDELKNRPDKTKYACIALCVMLNNRVGLNFFSGTNQEGSRIAKVVFEELEVNVPPMKAIQSCFDSMIGSFIQKTSKESICVGPWIITTITGYKSIHDYMFDIYCVHVSKTMINMIISYGDSKLIRDRALLQSIWEYNENAIVIPNDFEQQFFKRILRDLSFCRVSDVLGSNQMKYESYRTKFLKYLNLIQFDVNVRDEYGKTPIHKASEGGYIDVVEMLCKKGAAVNLKEKSGKTPLIAASGRGHIDVMELLCKKGADVNLSDMYGWTPLTAASDNGHIDVVEMLCKKEADVNLYGDDGWTSLIAASQINYSDVVELLRYKEAGVNLMDTFGGTPLTEALENGHIDVVKLLCIKGGGVNTGTRAGWTPLTVASDHGHIDVVKMLCNNGAEINLSGWFGATPLTAASRGGHIDVVELLCNKGADINLRNEFRSTPLTAASENGHMDVVELLCNKGADVNLSGKFGSTPLTVSSENGHIDVVELLCNNGAEINLSGWFGSTPLTAASRRGHIDVVELLCNKGADVNLRGDNGLTPLEAASLYSRSNVAEMLRKKGAT